MQCACACDQQAALERERQATAWLGDKLRGERQVRAQMLRASWNPSPNPNSNPNPNPNPNLNPNPSPNQAGGALVLGALAVLAARRK